MEIRTSHSELQRNLDLYKCLLRAYASSIKIILRFAPQKTFRVLSLVQEYRKK